MDHSHYRYSALPRRPAPSSAAGLQAFVLLCLEHWHAVPPENALWDKRFVGEFGSFSPDYRSWTQREYGLRIGVYRVIDALQEAGIRPAVAAALVTNGLDLDGLIVRGTVQDGIALATRLITDVRAGG